jgi:hypothetical protein
MANKKRVFVLLMALTVLPNALFGDGYYVDGVLVPVRNMSAERFQSYATSMVKMVASQAYAVDVLPKELNEAIWREIHIYYDEEDEEIRVGDVFVFAHGRKSSKPKLLQVFLRLEKIDNKWIFKFYACQWK